MKHQIAKTYTIDSTPEKVWDSLTNPEVIGVWSGAKAKMSAENGTTFSLWNGDIYGTNTEVVLKELLKQDWYGGKWDKPSKVTFTLTENANKVNLNLIQDDVPVNEVANFDSGWDDYYLSAIKDYLEQ